MRISRFSWIFGLALMAPSVAIAQDQSGDQTQGQPDSAPAAAPSDSVAALQGLWRVDRTEGGAAAADSMMGRIIKIDRMAIASLSAGTCSSPAFASSGDATTQTVAISCVGQVLATAQWDTATPDAVTWSEPDLQVVLHRITGPDAQDSGDPGGSDQGGSEQGAGEGTDDSQ